MHIICLKIEMFTRVVAVEIEKCMVMPRTKKKLDYDADQFL